MELLLLQTDLKWLDPPANLRQVDRLLEDAPGGLKGVDIIILPEMFATGFCMDPSLCVGAAPDIVAWMRTTASRYDSAVAGTVAVESEGRYFNRFYFVRPDGEIIAYDKRHLFRYGGEHEHYTPGTRRVIVRWRGFRILLQTCYDLRFPVFARNADDYDLMINCANWPAARIHVWDTLLKARAIENVCYVAGVNRMGTDHVDTFPGRSSVVDFKGRPAASLPDGEEGGIRYSLSLEELHRFREKFPVLKDADEFVLA